MEVVRSGGDADVAARIVERVAQKGFAVVDMRFDADDLKKALEEAKELENTGKFDMPPAPVAPALLGEAGSGMIAEFAGESGDQLRAIDEHFGAISAALEPLCEHPLGFSATSRSRSLLHLAGEAGGVEDTPEEMTDQAAQEWLECCQKQRLMLILFLGPSNGTLTLQPFRFEEDDPIEIQTTPGMLVAVRSDSLLHTFASEKRSLAASCFVNTDAMMEQKCEFFDEGVVPAGKEIVEHIMNRLRKMKDDEDIDEDGVASWDPDTPAEWRSAMNHMYRKGPQVAIRGVAAKHPTSWTPYEAALAVTQGLDVVREVPILRFEIKEVFDADPNSYYYAKSYSRHGGFIEGAEYFDPKPFAISIVESKGMDPCQRHILETSYEALLSAGWTKKQVMRKLIGIYIGTQVPAEYQWAPVCGDMGGTGTSSAGAIVSNRISFCLGMQGPSYTIDAHGTASLAAVSNAVNSVRWQTDLYKPVIASVAGAASLILAPQAYVLMCAAQWLSLSGRVWAFDNAADGWTRGDGVAAIDVDELKRIVDGYEVEDEKANYGQIVGVSMNHVGRAAGLKAPHGPAERELIQEAIKQAGISPLDVDCVEAVGDGGLLGDAVEATVLNNFMRAEQEGYCCPLQLASVKTNYSNNVECAGLTQLIKAMFAAKHSAQWPMNHLKELNMHIGEDRREGISFTTESLQNAHLSCFTGMTGRGAGGSLGHVVYWGRCDGDLRTQRTKKDENNPQIAYWPSGGGEVDEDSYPSKTYQICGSWSDWKTSVVMDKQKDGTFAANVTLGVNRFEHFHININGDDESTLHPGVEHAGKHTAAKGPADAANVSELLWCIDARPRSEETGIGYIEGQGDEGWIEDPLHTPGEPGDVFRVSLRVKGKYRTVDWEKVEDSTSKGRVEDDGRYYLMADWNGYSLLDPLDEDGKKPGTYKYKVTLPVADGYFQICRNQSMQQVFYPWDEDDNIVGPADRHEEKFWHISGEPKQTWEIVFRRTVEVGGKDECSISMNQI